MTTFLPICSVNTANDELFELIARGKAAKFRHDISPIYRECAPNEIATCIVFQL